MEVSSYKQQEMGQQNQINLGSIIGQMSSINEVETQDYNEPLWQEENKNNKYKLDETEIRDDHVPESPKMQER